jgi:hypothetical protein
MYRIALFAVVILLDVLILSALASDSQVEVARIQAATWSYVVFAVTVTTVKIVALTLGYLIAKLGYSTMMAGVQGKDSVDLSAFGASFKFKGVTPGLALGIIGVLMMGWALSTKHQFSTQVSKAATELRDGSVETNRSQEVNKDVQIKPVPPKL